MRQGSKRPFLWLGYMSKTLKVVQQRLSATIALGLRGRLEEDVDKEATSQETLAFRTHFQSRTCEKYVDWSRRRRAGGSPGRTFGSLRTTRCCRGLRIHARVLSRVSLEIDGVHNELVAQQLLCMAVPRAVGARSRKRGTGKRDPPD